jgi:hypothetical protein
MPRPIKLLNSYNVRAGIPEKFVTRATELTIPPSQAIPYVGIDEGNVLPKFMRGTVINAPQEQSLVT